MSRDKKTKNKEPRQDRESSSDRSFSILSEQDITKIVNKAVVAAMMEFKQENKLLASRLTKLEKLCATQSAEIKDLKTAVNLNEKKRTAEINDMEQYSRRWSVRIFGVAEKEEENVVTEALNIINNKLKLPHITEDNIDVAHRTGRKQNNRHRAIIVRFLRVKHRQQVLRSRKQLKGTRVTIAEDLTLQNLNLLKKAKELDETKMAWSWDGKIWMLKKDGSVCKLNLFDNN